MNTRITPEKLGRLWGVGAQTIRLGMQREELPIGKAIKVKSAYSYIIFHDKVASYMGVTRDELTQMLKEVER